MIIELTPDTFFEYVYKEGPLHVVMHYGKNCGPCKRTMPLYEILAKHFEENNFTNIKFYTFHQWEPDYKEFIETNNLNTNGVPTFRYYYFKEVLHEVSSGYSDANVIKDVVAEVVKGIENTMGGFELHES